MTVAESQDIFVRALCVWREMRGESPDARLACYWVINNRAADVLNRWPKTVYEVVTQAMQFSSFNRTDPNSGILPKRALEDWQAWLEIRDMCDNPGDDPTGGANAYEALPDGQPRPHWATQAALVRQIGKTRFYKL